MMFALGVIVGILVSVLIVLTLVFFRASVEKKIKIIERVVEAAGPKPKGFIYEPPSEADEAREDIIARNRKEGKDTRMEELL